jgi:sterol desaturase/sphingolipid hydroxylase (fatty acid hydroxylase superfamily)
MVVIGDFIGYWTAIFIHANVSWGFGKLGVLVASPKFHRWHHTSEDEGLDKNFAGLLPVFDIVFGTYCMPAGRLITRAVRFEERRRADGTARPARLPIPARRAGPSRRAVTPQRAMTLAGGVAAG